MGNEVKWIKFTTNMFDDEKIDFIESMPEADTILVVWFKLLCLAGKCNAGGYLLLTETIPYDEDMLSHKFRKKPKIIELALETFKRLGMIQIDESGIFIPYIAENQDLDKLEKMRQKNRDRVRAYREKQKALLRSGNVTCNVTDGVTSNDTDIIMGNDTEIQQIPGVLKDCNITGNVTVTDDVTPCNAIDIDIELDKDKEKDINNIPYVEIIEYLNRATGKNYRSGTKKTRTLIRARWKEGFDLKNFKNVIDKKTCEWLNTDYEKFLRPETLFGTKFESYLNQSSPTSPNNQNFMKESIYHRDVDFSKFREN